MVGRCPGLRIGWEKGQMALWLTRRVENEEARVLSHPFDRAQFLPDGILHYAAPENALAAVEQLAGALQARGGKAVAAAVRRQI
jgi:hypothetical protein